MKDQTVRLDFDRVNRKGVGEVIYCPGKSDDQLKAIARQINEGRVNMAFSRVSGHQADLLKTILPVLEYDPVSSLGVVRYEPVSPIGHIAVLSAGSSDVPIAEEAAQIAEFSGCLVKRYYDVGVAGLHRLLEVLPQIREADVLIVAAGMDGALPSVACGLVSSLVIGLPTSVGYGAADGGKSAMNAMLCSCSPGVVVVNVDNGIGAGLAAAVAVKRMIQHRDKTES